MTHLYLHANQYPCGPLKIQLEPAYQRTAGMATVTGCFDGFE